MLGHEIPSPEAARHFLYQFHEEEKIALAKGRRSGDEIAHIPEETEPLKVVDGGEPEPGSGGGTALSGAAHRHGGPGRDDY